VNFFEFIQNIKIYERPIFYIIFILFGKNRVPRKKKYDRDPKNIPLKSSPNE